MIPHDYHDHLRRAEEYLGQHKHFGPVVQHHGPCTLQPTFELYPMLVRSIVAQLISTAAARTVTNRVLALVEKRLTPKRLLAVDDEALRGCGLTRAKCKSLKAVSEAFHAQPKLNQQIIDASDAEIRKILLPMPGIGPWTVDMVLMFGLGRLDVLPVGDMGIRIAAKQLFRKRTLPDAKALTQLAKTWQPYRTVACWYLWKTRDPAKPEGETEGW
jgi:DNA-3-methyladenine glycosylase II